MATLNLPDDAFTLVWRVVKARLQADTVLQASDIRLIFFDNSEAAKSLTDYQGAAVLFYAVMGRMSWFDEASQFGALIVNVDAVIPAIDDEDVMNLQGAIETALYPADSFAFGQSLVNAGAVTGRPLFMQPLSAPMSVAGRDGVMRTVGAFTIEVDRMLNP